MSRDYTTQYSFSRANRVCVCMCLLNRSTFKCGPSINGAVQNNIAALIAALKRFHVPVSGWITVNLATPFVHLLSGIPMVSQMRTHHTDLSLIGINSFGCVTF